MSRHELHQVEFSFVTVRAPDDPAPLFATMTGKGVILFAMKDVALTATLRE
jgi:hypothetical protein